MNLMDEVRRLLDDVGRYELTEDQFGKGLRFLLDQKPGTPKNNDRPRKKTPERMAVEAFLGATQWTVKQLIETLDEIVPMSSANFWDRTVKNVMAETPLAHFGWRKLPRSGEWSRQGAKSGLLDALKQIQGVGH